MEIPQKAALTKQEAMNGLMAYLSDLAPGTEFTPADLAQRLSETSGKSTSWYRMVLATDLTALGIVEFNPESGRYRVAPEKPSPSTKTVPVTKTRTGILAALAPLVCVRLGHNFRAVVKLGGEPIALECARCPAKWTVSKDLIKR